jgi:protein SDA1
MSSSGASGPGGSGKGGFADLDYLQLQNVMKKDPESYHDEFLQQLRYFHSSLTVFQQSSNASTGGRQTDARMKHFCQLISFLAHVAQCYKGA